MAQHAGHRPCGLALVLEIRIIMFRLLTSRTSGFLLQACTAELYSCTTSYTEEAMIRRSILCCSRDHSVETKECHKHSQATSQIHKHKLIIPPPISKEIPIYWRTHRSKPLIFTKKYACCPHLAKWLQKNTFSHSYACRPICKPMLKFSNKKIDPWSVCHSWTPVPQRWVVTQRSVPDGLRPQKCRFLGSNSKR